MEVTNNNIEKLCGLLQEALQYAPIVELDGWESQVNPFDLVEGSPEESVFTKEYAGNVCNNSFGKIELDSLGGEQFIRFNSNEHDEYDNTLKKNFVIETGMKICVNMHDKQIVIIECESPLKKLLKKDVNPFKVLLFSDKDRLAKLHAFCH